MTTIVPLGFELLPVTDSVGLESFDQIVQGPGPAAPSFFRPMNIYAEDGLFYATIYMCSAYDGMPMGQALAIWLSSLKSTDTLHLTVTSEAADIPLFLVSTVAAAMASCQAKIIFHLDQIMIDGLGYFALLADEVMVGSCGALFLPTYAEQRPQDASSTWKAVYDFYAQLVEEAVVKGILTVEEGDALHGGAPIRVDVSRFA